MKSAAQTVRILALTAALCAVWAVVAPALPRPELAETNYEANRLRIERWLLGSTASAALVGTSISGRLLPTYFAGTEWSNLANLGLDGANPLTGLELVLARPTPPEAVFLEIHRLMSPPGKNDQELLEYARGFSLRVSQWLPLTRAEYRPSSVLYGWLKSRQTGGAEAAPAPAPTDAAPPASAPSNAEPAWVARVRPLVRALQEKGVRVILVRLPVGRENPSDADAPHFGDEAAALLGLPLVDIYRLATKAGETFTYTDGLHLTPASAAAAAKWLARNADPRPSREPPPAPEANP